ncbi:MAG: 30S ribosomal protein S9 [Planctomycetes bacterium]|nr:30S ribosomal protein S9 [Planctomycetota bacterium]
MTDPETPTPVPGTPESTTEPVSTPTSEPVETPAPADPAHTPEPEAAAKTKPARKASTPSKKPASKATETTASPVEWSWGLGRRKSAVARVRIRPGKGIFLVNKRECDEYFTAARDRNDLQNVLEKTSMKNNIDIYVNVKGGGFTGQAGAIILGLGRAILKYDNSLEPILRDNKFLTRDPRKVERKKYGQPGARKRFQFSKR